MWLLLHRLCCALLHSPACAHLCVLCLYSPLQRSRIAFPATSLSPLRRPSSVAVAVCFCTRGRLSSPFSLPPQSLVNMSWREICRLQSISSAALPRWQGSEAHRQLALDARARIFGGAPMEGVSASAPRTLGKKNKLLLSRKETEGKRDAIEWPFVRQEILSGRTYREREKLAAKVQAGIKGLAAGMADGKDAKKKK